MLGTEPERERPIIGKKDLNALWILFSTYWDGPRTDERITPWLMFECHLAESVQIQFNYIPYISVYNMQ